jgi:hypothetical protein
MKHQGKLTNSQGGKCRLVGRLLEVLKLTVQPLF